MSILTRVDINGIDVTSYITSYTYEKTNGESIGIISCNAITSISNIVELAVGMTIEVWRGITTNTDNKVLIGYIEKFSPSGGLIEIIGKDILGNLVRKEVTKVYDSTVDPSAGRISAIFKDN